MEQRFSARLQDGVDGEQSPRFVKLPALDQRPGQQHAEFAPGEWRGLLVYLSKNSSGFRELL